ncbi:MAG: lytic transglycosylase domain-containing protein [Deltaproteobacteria bacterium]|nr:lytic transglycosylase domain-containing protein [Deltaproteobacteria bacterium]
MIPGRKILIVSGLILATTLFLIMATSRSIWTSELGVIDHTQGRHPARPVYQFPDKVTFCGVKVPLENQDVFEMLDREFHILVWDEAQVFLLLKRANRFFPALEAELTRRNMPQDLRYIPVAESGLKEYAFSPAGAAGVWQFMPQTGREHNLTKDQQYDERLNFFKATRAGLDFLAKLYDRLQDWPLAIAAYNCGEGRVEKEISDQGTNDYFKLDLPLETERYLFRIIAAKIILTNPEKYGYVLASKDLYRPKPIEQVTFHLPRKTHIRDIAAACGTYFKVIKELNPELLGRQLPAGDHTLYIPKTAVKDFQRNLDKLPDDAK